MQWGRQLKVNWHGETPTADIEGMFAATNLTALQQSLADRRLSAEIEHANDGWRALLSLGQLAAPLWLADALSELASAFYDQEMQSHPDRPAVMNVFTHDLVAALLAPIEDIIADVTAALADAGHHTMLSAPLHIRPGGNLDVTDLPDPLPMAYVQGLLAGARRIHTSAASELLDAQKKLTNDMTSTAPDWLTAGFQRLNGELQAAGARLDMAETRLTALAGKHGTSDSGDVSLLTALCRDLWTVVDTALVSGQMIADPHLLPEAPVEATSHQPVQRTSARQSFATPQAAPVAPSRPLPAEPPARPARPPERDKPLPVIAEGAPDVNEHERVTPSTQHTSTPALPDIHWPSIGNIGNTGSVQETQQHSRPPTLPSIKQDDNKEDDQAPVQFPDIG